MAAFAGKWKLVETENFEEYMKALGVGAVMRKMGATAKPNQEISLTGSEIHIKTSTTFKDSHLNFTLDQEFEETTPDGRKVKSVITAESDTKLIHKQSGDPESTIIREIIGDDYIMTLTCKDVTCKRKYQRA